MSNVGSSGKFGTSMDYSQLLELKRKHRVMNAIRLANPTNVPTIKPRLNQDKFTREPATNGVTDFYFSRGLSTLFTGAKVGGFQRQPLNFL